jgi:hypothetical protein
VSSDNLILRMPIGTNFPVSQEELEELARLIREKGEQPPEPPSREEEPA